MVSSRSFAVAILLLGLALSARAQPVERNLPPAAPTGAPTAPAPAVPPEVEDERPLAASLTRLVLLGPSQPALARGAGAGVDVGGAPRLDNPRSRSVLAAFLGRSLSRKLIAQIEAAVVREYRRLDHPFVQVSTPEQEVGEGVLQIRVVEFHIGRLSTPGAGSTEAAKILRALRLVPGDAIEDKRLMEDLDWAGRYPFRTISPTFRPGASLGDADLALTVYDARPWQVQAGYANSGSPSTGNDRFFVGVTAGAGWLNDAVLSAQITGSRDFWGTRAGAFSQPHPLYKSMAARLTVPTRPRQELELVLDAVETNESVQAFVVRQRTAEATLVYRAALSDFTRFEGDVAIGVEAKRQTRTVFFGGDAVLSSSVDVFQAYGAWSYRVNDRYGRSLLDLAVHASPGGLGSGNTASELAQFTNGRVRTARYAYATLNYVRLTRLPSNLSLTNQLEMQYAGRPLPASEQMGLGGPTAVRGYSLESGAFDDAVTLRNELRIQPLSKGLADGRVFQFGPYGFADVGYGRDDATRTDLTIASVGMGSDIQLGRQLFANISVGYPLNNANPTRAEHWVVDARVTFSY